VGKATPGGGESHTGRWGKPHRTVGKATPAVGKVTPDGQTVAAVSGYGTPRLPEEEQSADIEPPLLRDLERIAGEIAALGREAKIAS
jgi:hypothetical protein